ncbi:MAG TPA: hypothetical protein VG476_02470 [Acidimicrobiales bacterium]|nr:hypothetical protein [Acidimicrobiales bacterium]
MTNTTTADHAKWADLRRMVANYRHRSNPANYHGAQPDKDALLKLADEIMTEVQTLSDYALAPYRHTSANRVSVEPGMRVRVLVGYSEVCMHMRVAGTVMDVEVIAQEWPDGRESAHAQLWTLDGRRFSGSISLGEAGIFGNVGDLYTYGQALTPVTKDVFETEVSGAGTVLVYPVTVPKGTKVKFLGGPEPHYVVDDLSWLHRNDPARHDSTFRGIVVPLDQITWQER